MRKLILFFIFLISLFSAYASHNRAGEITYKWKGDPNDPTCSSLIYEITITTYTKTSSYLADRPTLDSVHLGDGSIESFARQSKFPIGSPNDDISENIYIKSHTYPGSGVYVIYFEDPNRNDGVINIPNSFYTPFAIQSTLIISPNICPRNSSPILLNPPIDRGCKGRIFIHNPAAYDPDGTDSLTYELTICRGSGNQPIPGYTFPSASNYFKLDAHTGDLIWDSPKDTGEYNVAFYINEWRNGYLIGRVERDMQIKIFQCENHPPIITPQPDTCVLAGSTLDVNITAHDPDNDFVTLTTTGEPYHVANPATFTPDINNGSNDTVSGLFSWKPGCTNVRRNPYWVEFKATDNYQDTPLVDLKGFFIRVIGPAPQNLNVTPQGNSMVLHWTPYFCSNAKRFNIYRRNGQSTDSIECPCENGVPSSTGYKFIGSTSKITDTTFIDSNNGKGLSIGSEYCYLITAVFADGSESCASPQACALLKKVLPVLTNVSVDTTDQSIGNMYVAWSPATDLDTTQYPFREYRLYHEANFSGSSETLIATFTNWTDTVYYDENINTKTTPSHYKLELYTDSSGSLSLRGSPPKASSVFLKIYATDNKLVLSWEEHVPWGNYRYDIFKFNSVTTNWDSINSTTAQTYTDSLLDNGFQYCYYVRSVGTYGAPNIKDTLINLSEQVCATPVDNVPPCAPKLTVTADCNEEANLLQWASPKLICGDGDVAFYKIYHSPDTLFHFEVIAIINNADSLSFLHANLNILTGCYKVTAVDSVGNESSAKAVCVDTCRQYVLPNVFTPNHDGVNDLFHPCDSLTAKELHSKCPPYKNVKDVEMKIYNRWGTLVYETTDKNINWDGKNKDSHGDCPEGTYFYTCKVNFIRLNGTETKELHGYVELIRGK